MSQAIRALRIVHPLPSALNAALVAALALVAGGGAGVAALLAIAMFGFQASIGALNDVADADLDQLARPDRPIPAGLIGRRSAILISVAGGSVGLAISAAFGLTVLVLGLAGLACGLAYDLALRRRGWGWLCFAAAFPLLLAWTWMAAAGGLPPGWQILLPLAALAGPTIHLANSLVDLEADARSGRTSLATRLGDRRARQALAVLTAVVHLGAWTVLLTAHVLSAAVFALAAGGSLAAAIGVSLSWRADAMARERGWLSQAAGLCLLAVAWAAATVGTGG